MCLEICFRCLRVGILCGVLEVIKYVEGVDFGYGGYQYDQFLIMFMISCGGCDEGGKIVFSFILLFVGEIIFVFFKVFFEEDGEFNIVIENIFIIDGYC